MGDTQSSGELCKLRLVVDKGRMRFEHWHIAKQSDTAGQMRMAMMDTSKYVAEVLW